MKPGNGAAGRIIIIGAGFSGTMTAIHLLRQARASLEIILIERDARQFGRGVAYGTELDCHLLNVPAANMSAFPDDPGHFWRWAQDRQSALLNPPWVPEMAPGAFLPRRAYGDYLNDVLNAAVAAAPAGVRLLRRAEKAMGATEMPEGVLVRMQGGTRLAADKLVLALGNFPPGDPFVANASFYASPRYHRNPWARGLLNQVLKSRACLLLGGGLTMVDWVVALQQAGYQGRIHVISRRGLWPQTHAGVAPTVFRIDAGAPPVTARAWLRAIRRHVRESGADWRAVIDTLRPDSQPLWNSLPLVEKRRFLRHLRPFWDCHRHRLAPVVARQLETLVRSGQVVRHVGRVQDYRESEAAVEAVIRPRSQPQTYVLEVDAVLNCSGSESDYRQLESPLVRDLFEQGLIRPDPLRLGLDVAPDGSLIREEGSRSERFYTLGPPEKGILWETTAVPEIRVQASQLAERLLTGSV